MTLASIIGGKSVLFKAKTLLGLLNKLIIMQLLLFAAPYMVSNAFSGTYIEDNLLREQWIAKAKALSTANIQDYEKRASVGDVDAQLILAYGLTGESDLPNEPDKAVKYLMMAAQQQNPFAQAILIYFVNAYSIDTISNEFAFEMALASSRQGNVFGIINAGTAYMIGNGSDQNIYKAYELMIKAFDLGHPDAASRLCILKDVSKDIGELALVDKIDKHRLHNKYECKADHIESKEPSDYITNLVNYGPDNINEVNSVIPDQVLQSIPGNSIATVSEEAKKLPEHLEQQRITAAKAEKARRAAEEQEQQRIATAKAEEARRAAEEQEQQRIATAKAEEVRRAAEEQEQQRITAAKAEEARKAAEEVEQHRIAAVKAEEEKAAAEAASLAVEKQKQKSILKAKEEEERIAVEIKDKHLAADKQKQPRIVAKAEDALRYKELKDLPKVGQSVQNFSVVTVLGHEISLDYYLGSVLIIDFFAPWCQTCRTYIPHLAELNNKYGKQGLQIIGMNVENDGDLAFTKFAADNNIRYLLAKASETTQFDLGIRSVPVIFVIDKNGRVARVFRTFNNEVWRDMNNIVKKLLAQ